jgi:hypothetical protein
MKKKIKITKRTLKESKNETPLDATTTMPPIGKITGKPRREDTTKFDPQNRGEEFQTTRQDIGYQTFSADPTVKASPEEIEAALTDVVKDKGLLAKIKDYIAGLFGSAEEVPAEIELDAPAASEEDVVEPDFSGPQPDYPEPAAIPDAPDVPIGEPEDIDQPVEPEEEIDFEAFLQEVSRRHNFKKRK